MILTFVIILIVSLIVAILLAPVERKLLEDNSKKCKHCGEKKTHA